MKILALLPMLTILFSCGIFKKNTTEEVADRIAPREATLVKEIPDSDPISISNVQVNGNTLQLNVSYSGGCEEHQFDLYGNFAVMKSMPPKRAIKLVHNANGDNCRELIEKTLKFDISEFAITQTSGSEIILLLDGYKLPINYKYEEK